MSTHQPSVLCNIPTTILEHIALEIVLLDSLGPPADLVPLLLTCQYVHHVLSLKHNRHLYARIFRSMFDYRAANRRFGPRANYSSNLAVQLKKYCLTLKRIRQANLDSETLTLDLWNAFFMMMENDGRNAVQLGWAGLRGFVDRLVRGRLWHGREDSHGWPAENTTNALALWLMWFTTDQETIDAEVATPEGLQRREQLMDLVRPYVVTAIRYPSFHAPDNHFDFPLASELQREFPYSLITPHGFYPLYRQPALLVERHTHYNMLLDIAAPPITIAAKLLYFSRSEAITLQIPTQLPIDRAAAIAIHLQEHPNESPHPSPTQADWREFNSHKGAKLVDKGKWDWRSEMTSEEAALEDDGVWRKGLKAVSAKWDNDWQRFTCCWDPWVVPPLKGVVYTYGTMHGLWQGRMLIPDVREYFTLVTSANFPPNFSVENPRMTMVPIFFYLHEHHCINPEYPTVTGGTHDGFDDGIRNGWFPEMEWSKHGGAVKITDKERGWVSKYETYTPGKENSHSPERCTQCKRRCAEEEAEMKFRAQERERLDMQSEEMTEQESKGKGKRKRDCKDVEAEPGHEERVKRKVAPPTTEHLEDSDALNNLPAALHPRGGVDSSDAPDDEPDDDDEDVDDDVSIHTATDDVASSPSTSTSRSFTPPMASTSTANLPPPLSPSHSPPNRPATPGEIREMANRALGPGRNVDQILDEVMSENDDNSSEEDDHEDYDEDDDDAASVPGITPDVTYDDGPEKFADEREDIDGLEHEEEEYTEYVENTCNGIQDIIITGETLPRHGQAFHHFQFYGRVRRWDGLIALVRIPTEPRFGIYIFRGYVTANRNWVGTWRVFTNNVRAIPLEGPFIASRVDEN